MLVAFFPVSCVPQDADQQNQSQNQSGDQSGQGDQPGPGEGPGDGPSVGPGPGDNPGSGDEPGPGDGPGGETDEDAPVALENATPKEIGKFLVSDRKIYSSTAFDKTSGLKLCGVVAYVGNDTGEENYRHGLVIAMKNFNGNGYPWNNSSSSYDNPNHYNILSEALDAKESGYSLSRLNSRNGDSYKWAAFYHSYWNNTGSDDRVTTTAPSNTSGWFMPSIFQWNQIVNGLTGTTARLTTMENANLSMLEANKTLEALGAQPLQNGAYWSSTEHSVENAWLYWANSGKARDSKKSWSYYIRSVLAF